MTVDFQSLILDTSQIKKDFFAYETDESLIATFEHNDLINDWHIERIRRFNASTTYLIHSLLRMATYGNLLTEGKNVIIENGISIDLVTEHRMACRDACINIDICIDKIKAFCRYYFFMNPVTTDDTKAWIKALKEYKAIDGWPFIESFISHCVALHDNKYTAYLTNVRNAEVHNESPFELVKYHFEGGSLQPIPDEYVVNSEKLHNTIVETVSLLIQVISSLQTLLENITPHSIYRYLSTQDGQLKNILKMSERYKQERIRFNEFDVNA